MRQSPQRFVAQLLGAFCLSVPFASAQNAPSPPSAVEEDGLIRDAFPELGGHLTSWRRSHGDAWRIWIDSQTGHTELIAGGAAEPAFAPFSEEEWEFVARDFLAASRDLHGVRVQDLQREFVRFLPLGNTGGSDKWTVAFQQVVDGIPVERGRVNVLMDSRGRLLSIQSTGLPERLREATVPLLAPEEALILADGDFLVREGVAPTRWTSPSLIYSLEASTGERRGRLVWRFDMHWSDMGFTPSGWTYRVDARTGQLLEPQPAVHYFDVGGTVSTLATPGVAPDTGSNPETVQPVPYARVTSSAGTVFTDVNGNFNFPGVNSTLNVTVEYAGTWNQVNNVAGSDYSLTVQASPGQGNSILMNPSPNETRTAEANAYVGVNVLRDWIKSIVPGDTTVDFLAQSNVNLNDTCNAFFDGSSTNYFLAGGGCINTAYSTVIAHEMGHWYNVLYGTGNGSDGMGEGNADVFAMYFYDDPVVGLDFCGTGCNIRTGLNTSAFCGDCCPGCYGGVHANGQPWMGAAWKVRANLNTSLGNSAGDLAADTLFLGWMNAFDQTQIRSIIETQWLILDDDDGNINNGTPNYPAIDAGFRTQGFPGVDLDLVLISGLTLPGNTESESGPYVVEATIEAPTNPPLLSANLFYRVNGGGFQSVAMSPLGSDRYRGEIPGQVSPAVVEYYVAGTDNNNNTDTFPSGAPAEVEDFSVGTLTVFFENDFEGSSDDGWVAGAPGDDATTGVWERVDPVATAAQPGEDTTPSPGVLCWVTGQQPSGGGLGTNDVDGGSTTLLSPTFDATGLNNPKIRYRRWYSNDTGASPGADIFVVDLSNDGGSSWTNVETVGPTGNETLGGWLEYEFDLASVLPLTANMRMRFVASDLGSGSIVEAAIDDILGSDLSSSGITDCNGNGIQDADDIANGTSQDCNSNGIPDECEPDCDGDGIPDDCEEDCNTNGVPDECEPDCDGDGLPDDCEEDCNANGTPDDCEQFADCNGNQRPDSCDIADGTSSDINSNGIPDECEEDCNANGIPDDFDIASGTSNDCNSNGIPDDCEPDCDGDGLPDDCEEDCNANGTPDDCEQFADCNGNQRPDSCDIADGTSSDVNGNSIPDECETDCNGNGIPDDFDIASGTSNDCNSNGIPDDCEPDCDGDGLPDDCEVDCNANGTPDDCEQFADCNGNQRPDNCDIADGTSNDVNGNGIPDECESDCNGNGIPDDFDISSGTSNDCNANGVPDECDPDCDGDGIPDDCEEDCNANGTPDDCEQFADCNGNQSPDSCDIADGTSSDVNGNGIPDECEPDCNGNGIPDDFDIASGTSNDCNSNGVPDYCEADCDGDGIPDACEEDCNANGTPDDCEQFADCNGNQRPDSCDIADGTSSDLNGNGVPDECEGDCNGNGVPDDFDISSGTSNDCNANGVPDECEPDCDGDGTPDDCEEDCNGNGTPDDCEQFADCNGNGLPDSCDIDSGFSTDVNGNGVPDDCECLTEVYCVGAANSVGAGGRMSTSGVPSVSANALILECNDVPASQFGVFFYGPNAVQVPFGNGFRCVGGSIARLPVVLIAGNGQASWPLDVTLPPSAPDQITVGSIWNFQFWYRDPAGGGPGFNLSDALRITFCE